MNCIHLGKSFVLNQWHIKKKLEKGKKNNSREKMLAEKYKSSWLSLEQYFQGQNNLITEY